MSNNNGGPAFPFATLAQKTEGGMSLRDYFAAKASSDDIEPYLYDMQEMIDYGMSFAKPNVREIHPLPCRSREEAKYIYSDAMLKARQQ